MPERLFALVNASPRNIPECIRRCYNLNGMGMDPGGVSPKAWSRLNIAWFSFITKGLSGTVELLKLVKD